MSKFKVGSFVEYTLTDEDRQHIQRGRDDGTRTRFGRPISHGFVFPALIVGVEKAKEPSLVEEPKPVNELMDTNTPEDTFNPNDEADKPKPTEFYNLKVFLDGTDEYWRQGALPDTLKGDDRTEGAFR